MNNIFITGEKIDLCVPQDSDFEQWASWFNSQEVTKYLEQGKYPNTPEMQRDFYQQAVESGRFLTLVKGKQGELLGVVSLSEIDYEKMSCQVAYLCPVKSPDAPLAPLEALAMCTQHAFERFGMNTVWAGHAYPGLKKWIQKTEAVGYKPYGVMPNGFKHGMTINDAAKTSITRETFKELTERRDGYLWPGEHRAKKLIDALRAKASLAERVHDSVKSLHEEHAQMLAGIEKSIEE